MSAKVFNIALLVHLLLHFLGVGHHIIAISIFILVTLRLLSKFGSGIVILEIIMFFTSLTYLLMCVLGYEVYNQKSKLAVLWVKTMSVPADQYFGYFIPASIFFFLGLGWHFKSNDPKDEGFELAKKIGKIKKTLYDSPKVGVKLSVIGLLFFIANSFISFGYLNTLMSYMIFTGILYLYFTPNSKVKYFFLILAISFFLYDALKSGMFTVVIYMGATIGSIIFIGRKISLFKKALIFCIAIGAVLIIQSVKSTIRGSKSVTNQFSVDKLFNDNLISEEGFFPIYVRFNQGVISALVLKRLPAEQDYDDGESIVNAVASSFVPRFFWPDKPESGGYFNMKHFANFTLRGYTMNIGPPAEAYGNFGPVYGVVFMFFFGLVIRFCYMLMIDYKQIGPLLILWLPLPFYQVLYCMENDILQAVNSLTKGMLFVYLIYRMTPELFSIDSGE